MLNKQDLDIVGYFFDFDKYNMPGMIDGKIKYLFTERNTLNPLHEGLTFVSIAYYETPKGVYGLIW